MATEAMRMAEPQEEGKNKLALDQEEALALMQKNPDLRNDVYTRNAIMNRKKHNGEPITSLVGFLANRAEELRKMREEGRESTDVNSAMVVNSVRPDIEEK